METISFIYNEYGLEISVDAYFRIITDKKPGDRLTSDDVILEETEFDTDIDVDILLVRRTATLPMIFDTIRNLIDQKAYEEWKNR